MITLTPEEEAILRPKYRRWLLQHIVTPWDTTEPMSFDDWFRAAADEAKENAKYE